MAELTLCSIEACGNEAKTRGWCEKHYCRWKRHGDPIAVRKRWRSSSEPAPQEKACTRCARVLPLLNFASSKRSGDGARSRCRVCTADEERARRDPERERTRALAYRQANPEAARERVRKWRAANPDRFAQTTAAWKASRPDEMKAQASRAYLKCRERPEYRINAAIKARLHAGITGRVKSGRRTLDLLGYTSEELRAHLEGQFRDGMSWENYGIRGWHIDHIRPLASFCYETPDDPEFKKAWALSNLQPLWAVDNWRKHAKWSPDEAAA